MIAALPVIIAAVTGVFVLISIGVLEWHLYTTPRSSVVGPAANPTPADQILSGVGSTVSGTGETVGAIGSSSTGWVPFAVLGVVGFTLLRQR